MRPLGGRRAPFPMGQAKKEKQPADMRGREAMERQATTFSLLLWTPEDSASLAAGCFGYSMRR